MASFSELSCQLDQFAHDIIPQFLQLEFRYLEHVIEIIFSYNWLAL